MLHCPLNAITIFTGKARQDHFDLVFLLVQGKRSGCLVDADTVPLAEVPIDPNPVGTRRQGLSRTFRHPARRLLGSISALVPDATGLLELNHHLRVIVPIAARGLRELKAVIAKQVAEDGLDLHHREG